MLTGLSLSRAGIAAGQVSLLFGGGEVALVLAPV